MCLLTASLVFSAYMLNREKWIEPNKMIFYDKIECSEHII